MEEKKSKNYFTKDTEKWIVIYNATEDPETKNRIFKEHLYFPFYKLAENIINTFKFYSIRDVDSVEDLKYDVISMLLEEDKLSRFDPERVGKSGKKVKAFSYFGTVIKRWLIATSNKDRKKMLKETQAEYYQNVFAENLEVETELTYTIAQIFDLWIQYAFEHLDKMFEDEFDRSIAEAVLTVFRTRKDLQIFKKKALYVYVREITKCETVCLTRVIQVLKESFYEFFQKFKDRGIFDSQG